jgi:protein-S-isoprenylcysteine O-methyltransferase Ste14
LPYSESGAGIAFYAVLVAFALLEWRVRLHSAFNRQGARSDRRSLLWVYLSVAGGLVGGFLLATHVLAAAIPDARWPIFGLGLVLMVCGIAIRQWAVWLLGRYFTIDVRVHPGQDVVEAGPYRWVRHPSYAGLLLTLAGIGLALGNWAGLVALLALPTAGLVHRIRVEERALLDGLGDRYRRFAAGRAHLIPGVW